LPKIEYGFTGQIDNVEITVSKAGGGSYISYGPEVDYGNQIIHRPRNGHVTVEEYSPTVFTGSFSASLVDPDNAGRDEAPIIARQVSGSFLAPAPYERDENYQVGEGSVRDAAFQNMLDQSPFSQEFFQEMAGVDGSPPQILCNNGISDAQLRSMGFKKGCGDIAKQIQAACTCECLVRENEEKIPECERHCRREWRNCPVDMSQVPTGLEEQIEYCSRKMKEKGVPEGQIPLFMNEIRKVPESMRPGLIGSLCG
ncbi:MAG: hypothetical protein OES90_11940, partial [Xanthomonadales bacterium]|nr:hypothetical protein [Xanthomonadales bacterium]